MPSSRRPVQGRARPPCEPGEPRHQAVGARARNVGSNAGDGGARRVSGTACRCPRTAPSAQGQQGSGVSVQESFLGLREAECPPVGGRPGSLQSRARAGGGAGRHGAPVPSRARPALDHLPSQSLEPGQTGGGPPSSAANRKIVLLPAERKIGLGPGGRPGPAAGQEQAIGWIQRIRAPPRPGSRVQPGPWASGHSGRSCRPSQD